MFKITLRAMAVLLLLAAPTWSVAEETPSARQLELADRLLRAMQVETQSMSALDAMLPAIAGGVSNSLTPEYQKLIVELTRDVIRDTLVPPMMARFRVVYAKTYSEAELIGITQFYEGPLGRAMLAKNPRVLAESAAITGELLPSVQTEMQRRLCEKIDCNRAGVAAPRPS